MDTIIFYAADIQQYCDWYTPPLMLFAFSSLKGIASLGTVYIDSDDDDDESLCSVHEFMFISSTIGHCC